MEMQVKFNFDGKESNLKCTVALDDKNHLVCRTTSRIRREFVTQHFNELTQEKIWPDNYYEAKVLLKNFINDIFLAFVLIFVAGLMISLSLNDILREVKNYRDNKHIYIVKLKV